MLGGAPIAFLTLSPLIMLPTTDGSCFPHKEPIHRDVPLRQIISLQLFWPASALGHALSGELQVGPAKPGFAAVVHFKGELQLPSDVVKLAGFVTFGRT